MRKLLPILGLLWASAAWAGTCGSGYLFSRRFDLAPAYNSNQTNFVWSGIITYAPLKTVANGGQVQHTANNGAGESGPADMVVCDAASAGNTIPFEVASYSATAGTAETYILLSTYSTSGNSVWIFLNNSGVSTSQQDAGLGTATNFWSTAGYVQVCHFPDGSTLNLTCSLTQSATTNHSATATTGQLDGGAAVTAGNYVDFGTTTALNPSPMSVEEWAKPAATGTGVQMIASKSDGTTGWDTYIFSSTWNFQMSSSGDSLCRVSGQTTSWTYLTGTSTATPNSSANFKLYVNGSLASCTTSSYAAASIPTNAFSLDFGRRPSGSTLDYAGSIDEFRLRNAVDSADWVLNNYLLQLYPTVTYAIVDPATEGSCPTGYAKSKAFAIAHQNVGSDLTDFPVTMAFNGTTGLPDDGLPNTFTLPDLKVTGSGGSILSSGNDIVFCDASSGGNLLNFEREIYTGTTGGSLFHVRIPTVSSTTDTVFWMFYGKSSDTDHSTPTGVWVGYNQVHHFADGTTLSVADSTNAANNATNNGGAAGTGQLDGGLLFSANTQYLAIANPPWGAGSRTLDFWVKAGTGAQVYYDQGTTTGNHRFLVSQNSSNQVVVDVQGASITGGRVLGDSLWHKVTATISGAGAVALYIDGELDTSASLGAIFTEITPAYFSKEFSGATGGIVGNADELRLSTSVRSADWINAEYHTEMASNGFTIMLDTQSPSGLTSGGNCFPIVIDHTKIPNTDQTNFRLPVRGRYPWLADVAHGGYALNSNSGHDIRFFSNSTCTSTLSYQRAYWDNATGDSAFWVQVPSASHTSDTTVYASVGVPSFTSDTSTTTVFSGTASVGHYHLASDYSTLSLSDSGSAGLPLTISPVPIPTAAYGPLGPMAYFPLNQQAWLAWVVSSGVDHLGAHGYPVGTMKRSMSAWFKLVPGSYLGIVNQNKTGNIVGFGNSDIDVYQISYAYPTTTNGSKLGTCIEAPLWDGASGAPQCQAASQASPQATPWFSPNNDLGWHYVVSVFPTGGGTLNSILTYIDGTLATPAYTAGTGTTAVNTTDQVGPTCGPLGNDNCGNLEIGGGAVSQDGNFYGYISEPDISTDAWSADLVKANYNCQVGPCYSFGSSAPLAGGSVKHRVIRH